MVSVGINHPFKTCIFGYLILPDEITDSYTWALSAFMEALSQVRPETTFTDGDHAIKRVVATVMPQATHRLCSWHIQNNATKNIHCELFSFGLSKLIPAKYSIDVFESR